jgi:hypothetical protein
LKKTGKRFLRRRNLMQGIEEKVREEKSTQYPLMVKLNEKGMTYEEIGRQFNVTKQRVHQIICCCRIGNGDYYEGRKLAREFRTYLNSLAKSETEKQKLFKDWLQDKGVKVSENNKNYSTYA